MLPPSNWDPIAYEHQLTELSLLQASILPPDESLVFIDDENDGGWNAALRMYAGLSPPALTDSGAASSFLSFPLDNNYGPSSSTSIHGYARTHIPSGPNPQLELGPKDHESMTPTRSADAFAPDPLNEVHSEPKFDRAPARFAVRVDGAPVWFDVTIPMSYRGTAGIGGVDGVEIDEGANEPLVRARGINAPLGKADSAYWAEVVRAKLTDVKETGSEYPIYELFTGHLLPLLKELLAQGPAHPDPASETDSNQDSGSGSGSGERYHVLFTSHHLKAPSKRRSLAAWSAEHSLAGFAKLGHPGVIYASGPQAGIERFVRDVKAMQWLALRVRFVEPLPLLDGTECETHEWIELEKVGEVVDWVKKRGRERFVVEMGIGSAGGSSSK